ncbi:PDZ and LIM domain protein 7 isoform X3 [Trichechus manatus latirostris]|uniref:PDZ and LIM domain protein 7 isoform X3 n=1 Tax=Trichechus manatus latirostris TaxID=127582 RepID=A0A2Y9QS90_TRIMA|nr:PDZ and LIM domain protein 7 isoform X3 [Trichechus manatus latirostris]
MQALSASHPWGRGAAPVFSKCVLPAGLLAEPDKGPVLQALGVLGAHPCLPGSWPGLVSSGQPTCPPTMRATHILFSSGAGTMDSFKVVLEGPAPWGFRLQGGKDFNVPLSISRLTPGGKAAQAGVAVGDWVLSIDGENAGALTHIEAQNKIRACGERLSLGLSRAQPAQSKLQKAPAPAADPPRYTFAPSASLNKTARPFGASPPADSAPQQNGQPIRPLVPNASKQRLMEDTEDWRPRPGTGQSRSFRILAHLTGTEFMQDPDEEHLKKSREKYVLELQSPRYTRLRDWHHQRSAHVLNVQS